VKVDDVQTFVQRHDRVDLGAVNAHLERLEARARAALRAEGFAESEMRLARTADLRYFGQAWEVGVELPPEPVDERAAAVTAERFHDAHERRFGYAYRQPPARSGEGSGRHVIEWVNLRVAGVGPMVRPKLRALPPGDGRPERAGAGARRVAFGGAWHPCPIYDRARLAPGDVLRGPAIVEEYGSTCVVFPGLRAEVDRLGNLVLTREAA
jgi:N-methylhydantoinase A